ncbi:putative transporter small subunit [Alkalilimnicola sp. S0819]|nr:putative transporter small subunit [Alkalilimnicola sp. S0819]
MQKLFALYVLIWPLISLAVLVVICRAVLRDRRAARRERRAMV